MKALILSDDRKGHESQSVAFCELKNLEFEICKISYKSKFLKFLSYIFDFLNLKFKIFKCENMDFNKFDIFVGAGSTTYYALKFLAKKYNKKSKKVIHHQKRGYKSFPALKITRLDVDKDIQHAGVGKSLLTVIKHFFVSDNRTGCRFLTVDA